MLIYKSKVITELNLPTSQLLFKQDIALAIKAEAFVNFTNGPIPDREIKGLSWFQRGLPQENVLVLVASKNGKEWLILADSDLPSPPMSKRLFISQHVEDVQKFQHMSGLLFATFGKEMKV